MDELKNLTASQCIILATSLASTSNIKALRTLTPLRQDVFDPELVLRILLSYLPEILEPNHYVPYVSEVATRLYLEQREDSIVDLEPIKQMSEQDARKRLRKLHLLQLEDTLGLRQSETDLLSRFVIHRAHRIDAETGLLNLIPGLAQPFLDRSEPLRTWYISTVLPLLRLDYEYYPREASRISLAHFENLHGRIGIATLLAPGEQQAEHSATTQRALSRDLRGLVAPWVYGSSQRKRRRVDKDIALSTASNMQPKLYFSEVLISEDQAATMEDWQYTFKWLLSVAVKDLPLAVNAIEEWDGPKDVDLGGNAGKQRHEFHGTNEQFNLDLLLQYCQTATACVYAAEQDTQATIHSAHVVLVRVAHLLGYDPPPDLATSISLLPKIQKQMSPLEEFPKLLLEYKEMLRPDHPLTRPNLETFGMLQMFTFSAYLLSNVNYATSIINIARVWLWSDGQDQLRLVQKIIHGLLSGSKTHTQWPVVRETLLWLWGWGVTPRPDSPCNGCGVFGKVDRGVLEKELLRAFLSSSSYAQVAKVFIDETSGRRPLPMDDVEAEIVNQAYEYYDNASNGNRTRGGMKKASDVVATFSPRFASSESFRQLQALLAATHALSFYSLTLQHGVPFQPVNIRASEDAITLINKVLEQNAHSYTKVDDLMSIGCNLVRARFKPSPAATSRDAQNAEAAAETRSTESRIVGMAIDAALREDDFETAYSYAVNRLEASTSTDATAQAQEEEGEADDDDDTSWRAAFAAGRRNPDPSTTSSSTPPQTLRHLEQRMELLSQALVLAPPPALPEILSAWQAVEATLLARLAHESEQTLRFDDDADSGLVRRAPGAFDEGGDVGAIQPRRKVLGSGAGEEAPLGLVDVFRGSWNAASRTLPLRRGGGGGAAAAPSTVAAGNANPRDPAEADYYRLHHQRARKRDVVANAVTGGLASGIGWVLGAAPVQQQEQH